MTKPWTPDDKRPTSLPMNQGYVYVPKPTGFERYAKAKASIDKENKKWRLKILRLTTSDRYGIEKL